MNECFYTICDYIIKLDYFSIQYCISFHSLKTRSAKAITSFKWRKQFLAMKKDNKCNYMIDWAPETIKFQGHFELETWIKPYRALAEKGPSLKPYLEIIDAQLSKKNTYCVKSKSGYVSTHFWLTGKFKTLHSPHETIHDRNYSGEIWTFIMY